MTTTKTFARARIAWSLWMMVLLDVRAEGSVVDDLSTETNGCLVLEWLDPHELLPAGERDMADETKRILREADIFARWDWSGDDAEPSSSRRREHRLRVVLVRSDPSGPGWRLRAETLGATLRGGNAAPPAVYIFYHAVVSTLARAPSSRARSRFRAFARVVAHEIAHAVAPQEPHARSGLMRAGLSPRLLTAKRDLAIDARWQRALRRGVAALCSER